ncbi:MAG: metalloregulator ArsR/SmtB family transcription factor [Sulfurimicrobium sp.]|nr:metalloregulator ArsR/SmtB family transcription factor [Sulfurimicrobium sp.]
MNEQFFFESLSDETRRRILVLILKHEELCVCELFQALDVPQPKVSRHLAVLREAVVLAQRREGLWV